MTDMKGTGAGAPRAARGRVMKITVRPGQPPRRLVDPVQWRARGGRFPPIPITGGVKDSDDDEDNELAALADSGGLSPEFGGALLGGGSPVPELFGAAAVQPPLGDTLVVPRPLARTDSNDDGVSPTELKTGAPGPALGGGAFAPLATAGAGVDEKERKRLWTWFRKLDMQETSHIGESNDSAHTWYPDYLTSFARLQGHPLTAGVT